jgi:hypothetical protein
MFPIEEADGCIGERIWYLASCGSRDVFSKDGVKEKIAGAVTGGMLGRRVSVD